MEYREYPAGPRLAPYVDRLWTLRGSAEEMAGAAQPVLPDGRTELIVHFGDAFERLAPGDGFERQSSMLFAGQLTAQLVLRPTGRAAVLGVRFHPFGGATILDIPQGRLAGATPSLEDLSPGLARALAPLRSMTDDPDAAVGSVRDIVEKAVIAGRVDDRIRYAVGAITASCGSLSIERLATMVGMTRRHLERRFVDLVGIPPKRLARIVRFQAAVRALQQGAIGQGAATAAQFGYADQPHFIREFRELAGCIPAEHGLQQAALTKFFVTGSTASVPPGNAPPADSVK